MSLRGETKKFLADELIRWVEKKQLTQVKASEILGIHQPQVSNILNGQLERFSVEYLMDCLHSAGYVFTMKSEEDKLSITMVNI